MRREISKTFFTCDEYITCPACRDFLFDDYWGIIDISTTKNSEWYICLKCLFIFRGYGFDESIDGGYNSFVEIIKEYTFNGKLFIDDDPIKTLNIDYIHDALEEHENIPGLVITETSNSKNCNCEDCQSQS